MVDVVAWVVAGSVGLAGMSSIASAGWAMQARREAKARDVVLGERENAARAIVDAKESAIASLHAFLDVKDAQIQALQQRNAALEELTPTRVREYAGRTRTLCEEYVDGVRLMIGIADASIAAMEAQLTEVRRTGALRLSATADDLVAKTSSASSVRTALATTLDRLEVDPNPELVEHCESLRARLWRAIGLEMPAPPVDVRDLVARLRAAPERRSARVAPALAAAAPAQSAPARVEMGRAVTIHEAARALPQSSEHAGERVPPVHVFDESDHYRVVAEVPGARPESVEIVATSVPGVIELRAAGASAFRRVLALGADVHASRASVELDAGILTVRVPKGMPIVGNGARLR